MNRIGASNLKLSVDYATQAALANPATATHRLHADQPGADAHVRPGRDVEDLPGRDRRRLDAEGAENVGLVLSNPKNLTAGAAPQIGPNGPAQLTINDDDVSTFAFSAPAYSVQRTTRPGTRRSPSTAPARPTSPRPSTTRRATGPRRRGLGLHAPRPGRSTSRPARPPRRSTSTVANDGAAEANETVNLTLTSGATTVDTSLLSIVDNDNPKASVQLSSPIYDVDEAGRHGDDHRDAQPRRRRRRDGRLRDRRRHRHGRLRLHRHARHADVHREREQRRPGTGETSKTIQIPIPQDPDAEDPETLTLALSNALPGASSVLGAPATGDGHDRRRRPARRDRLQVAALRRRRDRRPGDRDGRAARRRRRRGVGRLQTSDGSATAGSDYTATSGTLNWAAGDRADKTFTVPISWDGRAEGTESISLALTNPGGGADVGPNSAAVIRIGDDGAAAPSR